MKNSVYMLVFLLIIACANPGFLNAEAPAQNGPKIGKFSITVSAGIRSIPEKMYERVFGKNNLAYGLDLSYRIGKTTVVFLHSDYFSVNGSTTLTEEEAKLTITPIEAGMRIFLAKGKFVPYLGAGAGYYSVKEEVSIGNETNEFSANEVGFFAEGGLKFYFTNSLYVDIKGKYLFLNIVPEENIVNSNGGFIYLEERKLNGFSLMGGLGISF
jgi:outer membrane protein W